MTLLSVAQMNSQNDIETNFTVIESLIQQSKAQDAELIVFPENFVCFAAGKQRETAAQFEVIQQRLEKIDQRIQELNALKQRLSTWVDECKTTTDSCCPILQELKKGSTTAP